jgi:hypothetical protein
MKPATVIAFCMVFAIGFLANPAQAAKKWTIYQRQVEEQKRIASGEKANELTKKEADGLRSDMSSMSERIEKMKSKNGGKLSYADEGKIEKDLNKVTVKIEKLKLEKRVTAR